MSPDTQEGRAVVTRPASQDLRAPHGPRQSSGADGSAVVAAVLLLAAGGALFDRLLVRRCCWCQHAHLHYLPVGAGRSSVERAPRCRPHRRYLVEITDVLPVALVSGSRRGAA